MSLCDSVLGPVGNQTLSHTQSIIPNLNSGLVRLSLSTTSLVIPCILGMLLDGEPRERDI